ncbi:MAG: hypothetical protein IK092_01775, partial [Muribaculaceae bacterium]|nr:hypothetical protein [Muribaculaceae bacterium]
MMSENDDIEMNVDLEPTPQDVEPREEITSQPEPYVYKKTFLEKLGIKQFDLYIMKKFMGTFIFSILVLFA